MASRTWYVVAGEEELGPLGPNGLRRMIKRGEILPETMIRRGDHDVAIRADNVRGLFPEATATAPPTTMQGPYESLRALGWGNFALMCGWIGVGIFGLSTALDQRERALDMSGMHPPPGYDPAVDLIGAGAPFLGLGSIVIVTLFVVTGVPFTYWLWSARMNLPHLIVARTNYAPNWSIACWFVPILNLLRPYQVIEEIDRLSAEAAADGDARVRANSALLMPWWISTVLMAACLITYKLMPVATADEIATATLLHIAAAIAVMLAAGFGAIVFLRITQLQERAHRAHAEPVQVHYKKRA